MTKPIGFLQTKDLGPQAFASMTQPIMWREKAFELRRAADVLWAQVLADSDALMSSVKDGRIPDEVLLRHPPAVSAQFGMLAAFALENLLKAAVIGRRAEMEPTSELERALTTHNLSQLAQSAGFALVSDEETMLTVLTELSVVSGRYPVPRRSADVVAHRYTDFNAVHSGFHALFERLLATVELTLNVSKAMTPDGSPRAS